MVVAGAAVNDATVPVNADTLGGRPANDYVTDEEVVYYSGDIAIDETVPLNADTLQGYKASDFATTDWVKSEIANAQLGGGSDEGEIDLSGFALKTDVSAEIDNKISNIDYPVDSVNGKTGAVSLSAADVGARPNTWTPSASDVGATPASHAGNKNNPHSVTAAQVGARPNTWLPTIAEIGAAPADLETRVDSVAINNNALRRGNFISDVLNVDLNNPDSTANRSGYFDTSSTNLPSNEVAFGVRDVYFANAGFVIVEARCYMTDSSSKIWRNTFNKNAGGWIGWESLDKRDFLSVNGGHMKDGAYINFMAPNEGITWQYPGENYVLRPLAGTGLELLANKGNGYYAALKVKPDGKLCLGTTEITDLMVADGESKGHVHIHNDGEGGTIKIAGPNSTYHYEFDAFNDKALRLHTASKNPNGNAKFWSFQGDSGTFTTDRLEVGNPVAVQYGGTGARDDAGARSNLGVPASTHISPSMSGFDNYGFLLSRGGNTYGVSGGNDNYYLLIDASNNVHTGTQLNGASAISWNKVFTAATPPTPSEIGATSMTLLWKNASPTSMFTDQIVPVDWYGYDLIGVLSKGDFILLKAEVGASSMLKLIIENDNGTVCGSHRWVEIKESGVFIGTNYTMTILGKMQQNRCEPLEIYGIKGVQK